MKQKSHFFFGICYFLALNFFTSLFSFLAQLPTEPILASAKSSTFGIVAFWVYGGLPLYIIFSWFFTSIVFKLLNLLKSKINNHWVKMTVIIFTIFFSLTVPVYLFLGLPTLKIKSFAFPTVYFASSYFFAYLLKKYELKKN
jgi:hypothetical protein